MGVQHAKNQKKQSLRKGFLLYGVVLNKHRNHHRAGILLILVSRCSLLTDLNFAPFQICAQGFGLPLAAFFHPFMVPPGRFARIAHWLFGLVFRHRLYFRIHYIVAHGGA
jgi:hypothetical protein